MSCGQKNHNSYQLLYETWSNPNKKERFFVSYAVRGPMIVPKYGLRRDLPVNHPISGPVYEPSPLNNRWRFYDLK